MYTALDEIEFDKEIAIISNGVRVKRFYPAIDCACGDRVMPKIEANKHYTSTARFSTRKYCSKKCSDIAAKKTQKAKRKEHTTEARIREFRSKMEAIDYWLTGLAA